MTVHHATAPTATERLRAEALYPYHPHARAQGRIVTGPNT